MCDLFMSAMMSLTAAFSETLVLNGMFFSQPLYDVTDLVVDMLIVKSGGLGS